MQNSLILLICLSIMVWSCNSTTKSTNNDPTEETLASDQSVEFVENAPAEGFNITNSDPQAIAIADKVMEASGGRKAWDNTRYISWNFFGFRKLLWDKWTGDVKIQYVQSDLDILLNINTLQGKVRKDGTELDNPDSVAHYVKRGNSIWINDSYWLVMPLSLIHI